MTDTLEQMAKAIEQLTLRLAELEAHGQVNNQALDTTSSPTFAEILTSLTGTFVPAFTGSAGAGTFTYVRQLGYYVKLGGLVFVTGWVTISAISVAPTGNMAITGLPFACNASGDRYAMTFGLIDNFNYTNTAFQLVGRVNASNSQVALQETFDNVAEVAVPAANFTNAACNLMFSGSYRY